MKKIAAAALAATMTLSIGAVEAKAELPWENDPNPEFTSSTSYRAVDAFGRILEADNEAEAKRISAEWEAQEQLLLSSYENDKEKGYKYGTTFDIIWGTLLGVVALGGAASWAVQQGLINLPF